LKRIDFHIELSRTANQVRVTVFEDKSSSLQSIGYGKQ